MPPRQSIRKVIALLLAAIVAANVIWWDSAAVGIPALAALLLLAGASAGSYFFEGRGLLLRLTLGVFVGIAWIMLTGSIFYYTYALNFISESIVILTLPLFLWLDGSAKKYTLPTPQKISRRSVAQAALYAAFFIFLALALRILIRTEIVESVRSPWQILPAQFFLLFFLAAAALIVLALARARLVLLAAAPFFFLFFSVAALVYPLGYGFDPFVHQATEGYIAEHGTITPKPAAYIGQYALINIAHAATALPIEALDRWLLPVLLAIFLPAAGALSLRNPLAVALLPIMPVSMFAVTTPQAVANALLLIAVLLTLYFKQKTARSLAALWLIGLAAASTHPLAGVPLLVFLFIWSLRKPAQAAPAEARAPDLRPIRRIPSWFDPLRPVLQTFAALLGAIALPALFAIYGLLNGAGAGWRNDWMARTVAAVGELFSNLAAYESRFNILLDFTYLYGLNLAPILMVVAALVFIFRKKLKARGAGFLALGAIISLASGILLQAGIDFSFLPLYEQSGYGARLFGLAAIFLLPLFVIGLAHAAEIVFQKQGLLLRAGAVALLAGLLTTSLYLTYPHHDAYTTERGFNVGAADFAAVRFIEQDASGEPYIVLANQATSAAALKEFGFKQYFRFQTDDGPVTSFYYPLPTGGPLYQYYLRLVYEAPSVTTVREAMERAGVKLGYFVINRYWHLSEQIIERTKTQTDEWQSFDSGAVYVFKFIHL